uniref:TMV resistance protein N-like isoform X2 n=1 Tax=Fragaria vesca subsp. vesca TaxID=101020 RepID=UPI0005CB4FB0|nr:PREDICTED: TMV resistance protein N-like isoform X2 [Fragaria vesca subsp. vesca]
MELDLCGIVARERPYSHFLSFGLFPRKSPHPLLPLLASLKHLSSLTSLKLNDCNLREGEIPNEIGSLSTLRELELGGNNFVTLPASLHLLSDLEYISVEDCKRLEQLPDLPFNDRLWVVTSNCTSLKVFPDPSAFSTVGNLDSSYFLYSMLKRLLEEAPSFRFFCCVLPGSEMFEWFSNQSLGDTVTEKIPSNSKWIGFAVCALIAPHDNPSAVSEFPYLHPGSNRCLKIKKCGVRALYENDMEEFKSVYEQGGASLREQPSCGSDDEYYSAEE